MTRRFNVVLIAVIIVGALFGGVVGNQVLATDSDEKRAIERFAHLVDVVESSYPEDVESEKVVFSAIRGVLRTLDPHTNFLEPKTYKSMREEQRGHFSGLGIVVTKKQDRLTVISPIEDTPAFRLGIRAGDVIANIEGEPTAEMLLDTAVGKLKGAKGTQVTITIKRLGVEPFDLTITRDDIPTKSVSRAFHVKPKVGYIRIKNFTQTSYDEVREALSKLEESGLEGLILDLRSNPGGLLDQAVKISDLFVGKGQTIVYTKGRLPESNQSFVAKHDARVTYPLVVLVNRGSASASEIVSGAIQDHDRGLIVGETTWGKGLVQSVYSLKYDAGLALTTAKYYTPAGRSIQRDYSNSFEDYYDYDPAASPSSDPEDMVTTDSGRTVFGGGGIAPDHAVERPENSDFVQRLGRKDVFFKFGVTYASQHEIGLDFVAGEKVMDAFRGFLGEEEIEFTEEEFAPDAEQLSVLIEERILAAEYNLEVGARRAVDSDVYVKRAIELLPDAKELRERADLTIARRSTNPDEGDPSGFAVTEGAPKDLERD